jgi:hypothetical protein
MALSERRWKQFAESRYAHEREALEFLREFLPDRDPTFLYSNFEFIADDGSVNEIDALVATQAGVFLVELKSRGGIVEGIATSGNGKKTAACRRHLPNGPISF